MTNAGQDQDRGPEQTRGGPADRLRLAAVLFAVAFVLAYVARPRVGAPPGLEVALAAGAVSAALVSAMILALTTKQRDPRGLFEVAAGFEVAACLIIGLAEHWPPWPLEPVVRGVSWSCLVLVTFPWIAPARPRASLVVSLIAATASPVAMFLSMLKGNALPPVQAQAALLLPPYLCAGVAYLLARRLHGMRRGVAVRMGPYELIERLGEGGMGEVWRASHERLAKPAAVKLVRPQVVSKQVGEEPHVVFRRFEREARATAALTSAHTVSVFDYGYTPDGAFYYAMELLRGVDLETLVTRYGPQPPERVAALLLQVCDSLQEAHEAGLIHRDIKPANIYVCRLGTTHDFVKVLDFGLVISGDDAETRLTRLTQDGLASGTPAYMAPEMATRGQLDARADLYGLGCVAYFLLTGRLVFESKSPMKMLKDHVQTQPVPPSQRLGRALPEGLESAVLACLEKHPDRRPSSAGQLAALIRAVPFENPWTPERAAAWWKALQRQA